MRTGGTINLDIRSDSLKRGGSALISQSVYAGEATDTQEEETIVVLTRRRVAGPPRTNICKNVPWYAARKHAIDRNAKQQEAPLAAKIGLPRSRSHRKG